MFRNPTNGNILLPRTLSRVLKIILRTIENKSDTFKIATFHSLRYTFATHFLRYGGNVVMLAKILGHSNANFTIKTYIQPLNNDIHEAMSKIKF